MLGVPSACYFHYRKLARFRGRRGPWPNKLGKRSQSATSTSTFRKRNVASLADRVLKGDPHELILRLTVHPGRPPLRLRRADPPRWVHGPVPHRLLGHGGPP